jgi:hypothetical protein
MIGSLLYLCAFMPDIMRSVCMCARFQAAPKKCHLRAVKRIMRYLILTPYLGLWYPKGAHFKLIGYSDVDYVGYKVDRKSIFGTYLMDNVREASEERSSLNNVRLGVSAPVLLFGTNSFSSLALNSFSKYSYAIVCRYL